MEAVKKELREKILIGSGIIITIIVIKCLCFILMWK